MERHAILTQKHKVGTGGAGPIQKDIAANGDIVIAEVNVITAVAVFADDETAGIVGIGAPAAFKIIHEYVVLYRYIFNTVDVDMLIVAGLVVEDVAFDQNVMRAVVNLQNIVVVAIMHNVVTEGDVSDIAVTVTIHMDDQRRRTRA